MPLLAYGRRLLLAVALAAGASGCAAAYRTDMLRKDVRTDAQNAIADAKLDHGDMTIMGSVDHPDTTYDPGQPIMLSVETSKDAYVAILRVLENGDTTIVFPNRAQRDAAIHANTVLTIPAPRDPIKITADKPGVVLFEFIASTNGNSWLFKRAPDNGSDFADLGVTTRNIVSDLRSSLKVGSGPDIATAHQTVRIAGRSMF